MYALPTIQKMNSRASERQAAEAAILAAFTLHYSLSRRFRFWPNLFLGRWLKGV